MAHAAVLFGEYAPPRRAALTVLLNLVAPDDLAALERVAETIATALPEDALSCTHDMPFFSMSAAVSIVRWRSSDRCNLPAAQSSIHETAFKVGSRK
jgi:hypothetical protein